MRKRLKWITKLTALTLLASSSFAHAYVITGSGTTYDGTDVGAIDLQKGTVYKKSDNEFLGKKQGSKPKNELAWANSIIAPDDTTTYNNFKANDVSFYATDTPNIYAFKLLSTPAYFIIKNAQYYALYENLSNSSWGVFDLDLLPRAEFKLKSGSIISHVTEFGNTTASVPEPKTAALLGLAIIGLIFARRRKVI